MNERNFVVVGIVGMCTDSPEMMALIMTMKNKPQAVMMSFQREYAESYNWLIEVFCD